MQRLMIEATVPTLTPEQSLAGWRRECCIELLGEGSARVFVRAVEASSFRAAELQRAILFYRLDSRFTDLVGCVAHLQADFDLLADTARRAQPGKDNLFQPADFNRPAWERIQQGLDRWARSRGSTTRDSATQRASGLEASQGARGEPES